MFSIIIAVTYELSLIYIIVFSVIFVAVLEAYIALKQKGDFAGAGLKGTASHCIERPIEHLLPAALRDINSFVPSSSDLSRDYAQPYRSLEHLPTPTWSTSGMLLLTEVNLKNCGRGFLYQSVFNDEVSSRNRSLSRNAAHL